MFTGPVKGTVMGKYAILMNDFQLYFCLLPKHLDRKVFRAILPRFKFQSSIYNSFSKVNCSKHIW